MTEFVQGIHKFLADDDLRIVIPAYQRGYSWTREQHKVLWEDICNLLKKSEKTHFMGGVISIKDSNSGTRLEIIDGQQRITTISIFILALIKWARINIMGTNSENEQIRKESKKHFRTILRYIGELDGDEIDVVKLALKKNVNGQDPLRNDNDEYDKIVKIANNLNVYSKDKSVKSKIKLAFEFFYDKISEQIQDDNDLWFTSLVGALQRITIANIALERNKDNPQQVFESMNATGLSLKEADKCRNLMVLGRPISNPDDHSWQDIWERIENNTLIGCVSETDLFLQAFLRLYRTKERPGIGEVKVSRYYEFFKSVVKKCQSDDCEITKFYRLIERYSEYYSKFKTKLTKEYRSAYSIENSNVTQFLPLILELISYLENKWISNNDFGNTLKAMEIFIVRKQVCSQKIDIDRCIQRIISELNKLKCRGANVVELVKYYLIGEANNVRMIPDDELFELNLNKNLYDVNKQLCRNILVALEQSMQSKRSEIVNIEDTTIEHIYPQHPNKKCKDENKQKWLHKLGNLTLINFNRELSAYPFYDSDEEKKEIEEHNKGKKYERKDKVGCSVLIEADDGEKYEKKIGYKYSKLCLNDKLGEMKDKLGDMKQWEVSDIEIRHQALIQECLLLWPDINSSYRPVEDDISEGTLSHEDDDEFKVYSKYEICGYRFEEEDEVRLETNITSWPEFRKVCVEYLIYNYYDLVKRMLDENVNRGDDMIVSNVKKSKFYLKSEHVEDVFIFKPNNGNPEGMLPELRDMIKYLDLDPSEFVFFVTKKK